MSDETAALDPDSAPLSGLRFMLRALGSRNYRLFFVGQTISLIGTFLTQTATLWLVHHDLDSRARALGYVAFAGQLPTFLFPLFAGVLVERWNRRRLLVITQTLAMIESLLLAYFTWSHTITLPILLALVAFQGLINAFDIPARQSFLIELVDNREDLSNAIALNSSMLNGARLIGPVVGGFLIYFVGEASCFFIDGLSYIAVIISLLLMIVKPRAVPTERKRVMTDLVEGMKYAFGFPPIRSLLLLMSLVALSGIPYLTLLPAFAKEELHGGSRLYGFLQAAAGCGALIGAIFLASRKSVVGLGKVIALAAMLFGAAIVGFANSTAIWLSLSLMLVAGFAMLSLSASINTVLQTLTEDHMRARVMSLFTISFIGMTPWGNLLITYFAGVESIGPRRALSAGGLCCILGGVCFFMVLPAMRKLVRPVYVRRGIIPEVAAGVGAASELRLPPET